MAMSEEQRAEVDKKQRVQAGVDISSVELRD
jgi:hypothetical protein